MYTNALLAAWPTLNRVERPRLGGVEFTFTDGESLYVAFVGAADGANGPYYSDYHNTFCLLTIRHNRSQYPPYIASCPNTAHPITSG